MHTSCDLQMLKTRSDKGVLKIVAVERYYMKGEEERLSCGKRDATRRYHGYVRGSLTYHDMQVN